MEKYLCKGEINIKMEAIEAFRRITKFFKKLKINLNISTITKISKFVDEFKNSIKNYYQSNIGSQMKNNFLIKNFKICLFFMNMK